MIAVDLISQYRIMPAADTLLHHAVKAVLASTGQHKFIGLILELLKVGYTMYRPNREGRTAISYAVEKNPPLPVLTKIIQGHHNAGFDVTRYTEESK